MTTKLLLLVSIVTWLAGCATSVSRPPVPPEYCTVDYEAQLPEIRRVAMVTTSEPPTIEAVRLGYTRGEGAAGGAAGGAAAGALAGIDLTLDVARSSSDPYTPIVALLLLPVLVVGGAVGGAVVGTATGYAPDTLAKAESNTQATLNSAYLQSEVLQRAQDYGLANVDLEFIRLPGFSPQPRLTSQAYTELADQSIDAVLEVELLKIELQYSLEMEARSRLVSSRTGNVLSENKHVFKSESRSLNEWTENGAAQLSETIQWGLTVLAEDIVDEDFSLFPRKERLNQFAKDDSGNFVNPDTAIKRIFARRRYGYGKPGSEFSPTLLNIPEGKSAIFIYRPASFLATEWAVPVMFNDKYLSRLPKDGFECLIVEPGMNTMVYPSQLTSPLAGSEEVAIVRESVETNSNEIAYFSVTVSPGIITAPVSVQSVIEKEAVDSLKANRRAGMQLINQE